MAKIQMATIAIHAAGDELVDPEISADPQVNGEVE
jgi:hypothetical protein